jgi:hypothetical protein
MPKNEEQSADTAIFLERSAGPVARAAVLAISDMRNSLHVESQPKPGEDPSRAFDGVVEHDELAIRI